MLPCCNKFAKKKRFKSFLGTCFAINLFSTGRFRSWNLELVKGKSSFISLQRKVQKFLLFSYLSGGGVGDRDSGKLATSLEIANDLIEPNVCSGLSGAPNTDAMPLWKKLNIDDVILIFVPEELSSIKTHAFLKDVNCELYIGLVHPRHNRHPLDAN